MKRVCPSAISRVAWVVILGVVTGVVAGETTLRSKVVPSSFPGIVPGREATIRFVVKAGPGITGVTVSTWATGGVELLKDDGEKSCAGETQGWECAYVATVRLRDRGFGSLAVRVRERGAAYEMTKVGVIDLGKMDVQRGGRTYGVDRPLEDLMLLNGAGRVAVVQFAGDPIQAIEVGDRLGRNGAVVKEIGDGVIVLEETVKKDGGAEVARVVLKKGEKGGTRFVISPDGEGSVVRKPGAVGLEKHKPADDRN